MVRITKKDRYVAVCDHGNHIVTDVQMLKDIRELDNGFIFKVGSTNYYSPYFFVTKDLESAWKFSDGAAGRKEPTFCPDKV